MQISRRSSGAIALAAFTIATAALAGDHPHWTYDGSGGPEHWGALSNDFAACAKGQQQSPVNLTSKTQLQDHENLKLAWKPFAPMVTNNGHTIQANSAGENTTTFAQKTYTLQQMHFHHTSEHTVDGKPAPMEAHFVNKGSDGKLLVLGVLINEGKANDEIAKLWAVAPKEPGEAKAKSDIDFTKLVPTGSKFFHYAGSLTTPPCSEIVDWIVFVDPITASKEQIATFAKLYPNNNRPVQALHDRTVTLGQ
jgi:carbonic anhydrase